MKSTKHRAPSPKLLDLANIKWNKAKALAFVLMAIASVSAFAGEGDGRVGLGVSALYDKGVDATVSYEHETSGHNAWEFFANGYVKWNEQTFFRNYRTWGLGAAYKPCVMRSKNHYGSLRFGASGGSDTNRFVGGVHVGYEHNYRLKGGWQFYWQVKSDIMIKGRDLFRSGFCLGMKFPTN